MFPKHASFILFVSSWLCANKMVKDGTTRGQGFLEMKHVH